MRKDVNSVLQGVVDRNKAQKEARIANMRAELVDLGYSVVTTEWLHAVLDGKAVVTMPRENVE